MYTEYNHIDRCYFLILRFDAHATRHHPAHIYRDTLNIICLTFGHLLAGHLFVDQPAQLAQKVGPKQSAPSANRDHRIRRANIRPFHWQCTQPLFCVQIRHTIPAPVVTHNQHFEGLSPQWMERVRDGENF